MDIANSLYPLNYHRKLTIVVTSSPITDRNITGKTNTIYHTHRGTNLFRKFWRTGPINGANRNDRSQPKCNSYQAVLSDPGRVVSERAKVDFCSELGTSCNLIRSKLTWAPFHQHFSIAIQIWWKFHFTLTSIICFMCIFLRSGGQQWNHSKLNFPSNLKCVKNTLNEIGPWSRQHMLLFSRCK